MAALAEMPTISDVRQAIVRYLIDDADKPCVSISEMIGAMRGIFALCELTDWQLSDLIARIAIDAGFAIEFDAGRP
ncbi:hypothetical protein EH240_15620 [Mesorhizobium tamadayense]|uniref:Uncharacterized protein n=1 Tax=Mesorhizobium tamadayense TaxID=425306 RepID=A0A3P3FRE2_9HYPH|nr:hypothetical protein [Mesorhizobium tamadayense]RRI01124.1 hypothetical protein EH240_15620 [Mesorhizobium tamadayense]